jgi:microcystin-dependent protein
MGSPYLTELRLVSFNFAPRGWAMCNGQLLPINQNQAIFSLVGTTYGGNGQTTFGLPDLRSRIPLHFGVGHTQGERGGEENHTLNISEVPAHTHQMVATSNQADATKPTGHLLGATVSPNTGPTLTIYGGASNLVAMSPQIIQNAGGSQPHTNQQPYLVLNWIIALSGIFPSRN